MHEQSPYLHHIKPYPHQNPQKTHYLRLGMAVAKAQSLRSHIILCTKIGITGADSIFNSTGLETFS
jgi:hypothetical protein